LTLAAHLAQSRHEGHGVPGAEAVVRLQPGDDVRGLDVGPEQPAFGGESVEVLRAEAGLGLDGVEIRLNRHGVLALDRISGINAAG
jgi:hypothetical protein